MLNLQVSASMDGYCSDPDRTGDDALLKCSASKNRKWITEGIYRYSMLQIDRFDEQFHQIKTFHRANKKKDNQDWAFWNLNHFEKDIEHVEKNIFDCSNMC